MFSELNILIVSDDAEVGSSICGKLDRMRCKQVPTAREALDTVGENETVLAFIDVDLPDMPGIELLRLFSKNYGNTYCIALIGGAEEKLIPMTFRAGARDFLRKPIGKDALAQILTGCKAFLSERQGRAAQEHDLQKAELNLELESSANAILPALASVSQLLRAFVEESVRKRIELALDEALRNAYEHGNLGISGEEKIAYCEAGTFELELEKRGKLAQKAGKKILLKIELDQKRVVCTIEDEGEGFDWRKNGLRAAAPASPMRSSGRGLYLIQQFFEKITYNDKGNQIRLEKTL